MKKEDDTLLDRLIERALSYKASCDIEFEEIATPIDGLTLVRSSSVQQLSPVVYEPVFCLVLQGEKEVSAVGECVRFGRMESLCVSVDTPALPRIVKASRSTPYIALALQLDAGILHSLVHEDGVQATKGPRKTIATLPNNRALLDAMMRLFELTELPEAIPILQPLILREIHYRLLASKQGAMLAKLVEVDSSTARIARIIRTIKHRINDTLNIEELAASANMSRSAFYAHFRSVTGTSPLQFQKQLRLIKARQFLQSQRYSVAGAAFAVGYESPTQFSREYARLYGVSPRNHKAAPNH